jgi:hypothetical protein
MHQERAATDAGALRFNQSQDRLRGNSRIYRAATGPQNIATCRRGERICRRYHVLARELWRNGTARNQGGKPDNGTGPAEAGQIFSFKYQWFNHIRMEILSHVRKRG